MRPFHEAVAVLLSVCVFGTTEEVWAASSEAAEFAGHLLQSHPTLLTATDRAALDEINRMLRQAEGASRAAADGATREQATTRAAAATARLVALLEGCSAVRRVVLDSDQISPSFNGPFMLPSDEAVLLFRVESGSGEMRFVTRTLDQSKTQHTGAIDITGLAHGVTWLLMDFHHLPLGQTSYPVEIGLDGADPAHALITLITPRTGRVKITAIDDDDGAPSPVMMRITSKATGRDRPPSNALEFGAQFEGNGNASGHRKAYLFGRLGGDWWIVPGPFEMALPPGDYEIAVRRGAEHVPVFDEFTVSEGGLTEKTYRPRRWVDMRTLGWHSGDDHVHARLTSDSDAERLMAWVRAEDVHVANVVKMGDTYRTYFEQRGSGRAHRVIRGDYVLVPGQEDPRTFQMGHALSMNIQGHVRDIEKYYLYDWVADTVRAQGGLFGYAHAGDGWFHVERGMSVNIPKGKVDFVEVMQYTTVGTALWYDFLNTGFKLTATAGSDVPWAGTVGEVRTYAWLGQEPFSADAWFEAVRSGRTFVTNGPMVEFRVDEAMLGDEIRVTGPDRVLRVKARAWGHPDRNVPVKLTILKFGEVLREVKAAEAVLDELSVDFTVTADDGFWIAARADANDGSIAHTTPIYVTRAGLRFWKYDQVQDLLDKRLRSLSGIEQAVTAAVEANGTRKGRAAFEQFPPEERAWLSHLARTDPELYRGLKVELGDSLVLLAAQGPQLLERVHEAKQLYLQLEQTAKREKSLRTRRERSN